MINASPSDIILALNLVPVIKGSIIVIQLIYVLYAFLLTRQIKHLNESFCTPQENLFKLGALIHFIAAFIIFIVTTMFFW